MHDSTGPSLIESSVAPLRRRLETHPLYSCIVDERSLRTMMEAHVFAVWDFQCLLTALQRLVTCVEVPWVPTADPLARRLVNEIVLDEESDEAPGGGYLSHFELYLMAMRECGADTQPIEAVVNGVLEGLSVEEALDAPLLPLGVRPFVNETMDVARSGDVHRVAAAFAYGREHVVPVMFRQLVDSLAVAAPRSWSTLRYYLDRHIHKDGVEHGPQAARLVERLCGKDATLWAEATETAQRSLRSRAQLWDTMAANVIRGRQGLASATA